MWRMSELNQDGMLFVHRTHPLVFSILFVSGLAMERVPRAMDTDGQKPTSYSELSV